MGEKDTVHYIVERLTRAQTPEDLSKVFDRIGEVYGIENAVYHAVNVRGLTRDGAFLRLTYSDSWIARYFDQDYFSVDPVIDEANRSFLPFNWTQLDWNTRRRRDFLEDAIEHNVGRNGLTVPIRGPDGQLAFFSLTTDRPAKSWDQQLRSKLTELHSLAHHFHQANLRVEGVEQPEAQSSLTTREREVLQWAAAGKTTEEVATILGIGERTVRVYLDTSRHKLGATNRTHAVARALCMGLIQPPN